MRGRQDRQLSMLCALNPEELVPAEHALRGIKALTDRALGDMDDELEAMYASHGRPSVPPERLLKSMLLMALYSIRSDRQFCEQLRYNLLYRWFLDMEMTDAVWDRTTFSHNRERLLEHDVARVLFGMVVEQAREQKLTSSEHFSVDGRPRPDGKPQRSAGGLRADASKRPGGNRGRKCVASTPATAPVRRYANASKRSSAR
jgi:transposase